MKPEYKEKWIKALESGAYDQAQMRLKSPQGWCCLGVLCELVEPNWETTQHGSKGNPRTSDGIQIGLSGILTPQGLEFFGLTHDEMEKAYDLNDVKGYSFPQIAAWIRETL